MRKAGRREKNTAKTLSPPRKPIALWAGLPAPRTPRKQKSKHPQITQMSQIFQRLNAESRNGAVPFLLSSFGTIAAAGSFS